VAGFLLYNLENILLELRPIRQGKNWQKPEKSVQVIQGCVIFYVSQRVQKRKFLWNLLCFGELLRLLSLAHW